MKNLIIIIKAVMRKINKEISMRLRNINGSREAVAKDKYVMQEPEK